MSEICSNNQSNKTCMEKLIDDNFQSASDEDRLRIKQALASLGVDCIEDLKYMTENDLKKEKIKVIHMRKLLDISQQVTEEQMYQESTPDDPSNMSETERKETTKNLAIATGVLGGVTAVATPLAIFAALFPPITLPIAIVAGAGAGVIAAATAGTGIATAVTANKSKGKDDNTNDDAGNNQNQDNDSENDEKKKLV